LDWHEFDLGIRKALGYPKIHPAARDNYGEFVRSKSTEIFLNYDWIKNPGFYQWLTKDDRILFGEGSMGISVWIA
jgi:hypothetical protein